MSHSTSLVLSLVIASFYAGLFIRHYLHPDGLGRLFVLGITASLSAFFLARAAGYGILIWGDNVNAVNELLRWSAYAVAIPGVWMVAMEVRHGR